MACLAGCSDNSLDNGMAKNPVQEGEEILFGSSLSDEVESRTVYGDRDENELQYIGLRGMKLPYSVRKHLSLPITW